MMIVRCIFVETTVPVRIRPRMDTLYPTLILHFSFLASQNIQSSEWALLVNVFSINGILWCPEAQANVLVPSSSTFSCTPRLGCRSVVLEDMRLLLESALTLYGKFGSHVDGWL
jgi:hypothetical protein